MRLKSIILGSIFTFLLLLGLVLTRLITLDLDDDTLVLTEIEELSLTPPPPPPLEELPEVEQELEEVTPPPPSFTDVPRIMDTPSLAVPTADVPVELDREVDLFSQDTTPAELPTVKAVKRKPKAPKPKVKRPAPKRPVKRSTTIGDLDSKPRLIRKGRFRWPASVRDKQVKAVAYVELNAQGRIKVIRINSISSPKFRPTLLKFIRGCRFSTPKVDGKPVNAVRYNWPITLQKP